MSRHKSHVVGRCFACGDPLTAASMVRVYDPAIKLDRKVHRGSCEDRLRVQIGPQERQGR